MPKRYIQPELYCEHGEHCPKNEMDDDEMGVNETVVIGPGAEIDQPIVFGTEFAKPICAACPSQKVRYYVEVPA